MGSEYLKICLGVNIMKILIVDDDLIQLNGIRNIIAEIVPTSIIYTACDFLSAKEYIAKENLDLFFLDIDLVDANPDNNGVTLGKYIRTFTKFAFSQVIYITSLPEMIFDAVNDIHCFKYLLKPYSPNDIIRIFNEINLPTKKEEERISFHTPQRISVYIKINDILYITSEKHRMLVATTNGIFETYEYSLKEFLCMLPENFVQCHKKYIVNIKKIDNYDKTNNLIKIDKFSISVGRVYKNHVDERI